MKKKKQQQNLTKNKKLYRKSFENKSKLMSAFDITKRPQNLFINTHTH